MPHGQHVIVEPFATTDQLQVKLFEPNGAEERAQHSSSIIGLRQQKPLEPVLRQQDDLQELVLLERQDAAELERDVNRTGRHAAPACRAPGRLGRAGLDCQVTDVQAGIGL